ncbi:helix-hairpin-helix domain-containing protein [Massilia sp. BJB1822]|uniref:ComEA family DNA-binding protein n=1 Tax=Massilia sp. BJB1822 TaxID=2744470 RepID=UPI0015941D02|nr:helix-hairpin-helix domain-containing protein [Massilia sp. BJB1822]NVE00491.1 helix-hairpin-helix domain-containing protein [Massilia sp. BJB1822]
MFKKLMLAVATLIATMGFAFAQVDVNKADQAALDSVKGLGPAKTKAILDERNKNGEFKDWADLEKRVKGIGAKSAAKLSEAGLQVNGKALDGAAAKPAADKAAKADKAGKAEHKADAKAEMKAEKAEKADKAVKPADMKAADAGKSADAKKEPAKK